MLFFKLLIISLILPSTDAGADWKLRKDDTGVKVYTRSVKDSPYDEFKAEVTIPNTTVNNVLDIITGVKDYPKNFPNCGSSAVLVQKAKYDDIHYITIDTPWPVKKRDAIYETSTSFAKNGKYAKVKLTPRATLTKEREEYVRVYNGSGFWELEEVAPNTVWVSYQFHADPGGEIPGWIANAVIVSNPWKTMLSVKEKAKKF